MSGPCESSAAGDDLLERFEQLGPRVRRHFNCACATVRVIELGYGIYGHTPAPAAIVRYIRRRVYDGMDDDPEFHRHVLACRECRRLLRRHAVRKAILARLGLSVHDWSG